MNKISLNKYAISLFEKVFELNGFKIQPSNLPIGQVNFIAISNNKKELKIKVGAISQIGSCVY